MFVFVGGVGGVKVVEFGWGKDVRWLRGISDSSVASGGPFSFRLVEVVEGDDLWVGIRNLRNCFVVGDRCWAGRRGEARGG